MDNQDPPQSLPDTEKLPPLSPGHMIVSGEGIVAEVSDEASRRFYEEWKPGYEGDTTINYVGGDILQFKPAHYSLELDCRVCRMGTAKGSWTPGKKSTIACNHCEATYTVYLDHSTLRIFQE